MGYHLAYLVLGMMTLVGPTEALADGPAGAATPSSPTDEGIAEARERARTHFERGVVAYREGRYVAAREAFEAALATYPSPAFHFNLARTYERLGRPSRALRHYREYQRLTPNSQDQADVRQRISALERALLARPAQEVTIDTMPTGARVSIDGVPRGTVPFVGELSIGSHAIKLELPGYSAEEVTVEISGVEATDLSFSMTPVPEPSAPPRVAVEAPPPAAPKVQPVPAPPESGFPRLGTWTYVTLGASAAAWVGAGVLELVRRGYEHDVRGRDVQRERVDAHDTMEDYQTAARVGVGVGLGFAAVGATLLIIDLSADRPKKAPQVGSVMVGPGQLSLRGSW